MPAGFTDQQPGGARATTIIRILSREPYSVSAMIQIQKIHDDYWRIADKNNSRIAGISKVGKWYVVANANGRYDARFEYLGDAIDYLLCSNDY